ncbi:CG8043 [Drosophila busckii]|uniref:CG8043 n=1 Tax=Drosophila busckii TaxID=30019 RepID=A0A0M4EJS9_DROBS|nr:putative transferase CAF17, mitochondrial [Drosophila busckii]ALC47258.1 CG8043 [Drosophila busckii]
MNICKNFKFLRNMRGGIRNASMPGARSTASPYVLERLRNRELIRVNGAEVVPFLQGLVTNDVSRLQHPSGPASMYAMFLNRGGRVLFDTIIYRTNDPETFLLECDREASSDFRRHLRMFRVRKQIDIDTVEDEYVPWVLYNDQKPSEITQRSSKSSGLFISPDPRVGALGTRLLAPTDLNWPKLTKTLWRDVDIVAAESHPENSYQLLRYKHGVGEGVRELPPGKCFPLEANADYLNGVSFNKGCYIGQELTARVHHSGVIRKRYMPMRFTSPVSSNYTVKSIAGANLGRVLGHAQNRGVGLLRIDPVLNGEQQLVIDGERCYVDRPQWWPSDTKKNKLEAVE